MEKTFEAIMQAVKDGCNVSFKPSHIPNAVAVVVFNSVSRKGVTQQITFEFIDGIDSGLRDPAKQQTIKKATETVLLK